MLVRRQPPKPAYGVGALVRDLGGDLGGLAAQAGGDGVQIVLLDHGLYTEMGEEERRRMCRLWLAGPNPKL